MTIVFRITYEVLLRTRFFKEVSPISLFDWKMIKEDQMYGSYAERKNCMKSKRKIEINGNLLFYFLNTWNMIICIHFLCNYFISYICLMWQRVRSHCIYRSAASDSKRRRLTHASHAFGCHGASGKEGDKWSKSSLKSSRKLHLMPGIGLYKIRHLSQLNVSVLNTRYRGISFIKLINCVNLY